MGTLATKLVLLPLRDPESKGLVERRNGWFETSFMPGRTFRSPGDFNDQFTEWLTRTNARVVRTIKAAPVDLIEADRAAMLPLPPIPLYLGWRNKIRLGGDYYVRIDTGDYSVDPSVIGRLVEVSADLDHVKVRAEGSVVADHPRLWARGATVTDPVHVEAASCASPRSWFSCSFWGAPAASTDADMFGSVSVIIDPSCQLNRVGVSGRLHRNSDSPPAGQRDTTTVKNGVGGQGPGTVM